MKLTILIYFALPVFILSPFPVWGDIGSYYGTATITAPANLGTIDLAFDLEVDGSGKIQHDTSYIMLDKTLLFPSVLPQVNNKPVGPRVTGTASPTSFGLSTDNFSGSVSGKTVTRKVALNNSALTDGGNTITGTYTETITGLSKNTVTVTGNFILVRPMLQTIVVALNDRNSDNCIDLSEIRGAGTSQDVIEFNEMSQALHLFYNPQPNLRICSEQTIKDALTEFYAAQKQL